ncbi:MAG: putative lipid II flippase FtsW [Acidimicrobiales bacterium]
MVTRDGRTISQTRPDASERSRPPRPTEARPAGRVRALPVAGGAWVIIGIVVVLNLIGLVMVLSASSILSLRSFGTPWHFFERQVLWLAVGTAAFVVAYRSDYRRWRRLAPAAMVASVVMLVAVLVPGIGRSAGGASRWLGTSSIEIQPSEIAKLALVFFAADVLERRRHKRDWRYQMMPVVWVLVVLGALIIKQPDMGTTMVLAIIALAMLFTAGLPAKPLLGLVGAAAATGGLVAVAAPYRMQRLLSFRHPFAHASNSGYQAAQGLVSLSHGSLLGDGIGSSIASYGYLPNAQTDFIFAIIGEETGLVGTLLLTGLFFALALLGGRLVGRARDPFASLVAAGITAWLVGQACINIGAVVGLLPVTGVPLPFVSFGGSSLVISLFAVGVLANIAKAP